MPWATASAKPCPSSVMKAAAVRIRSRFPVTSPCTRVSAGRLRNSSPASRARREGAGGGEGDVMAGPAQFGAQIGGQARALLRRGYDQREGARGGGEVVGDAPVHGGRAGGEPACDVQAVFLREVHGPPAAARLPFVEGGEQFRAPGGGLAHEPAPVLLGVGVRARHRLAPSLRVRPPQLCLGGVTQVEGHLAEHLEALLGSQGHPGLLDLDGPLGHLGRPPQPVDLLVQLPLPLPGPEPLQRVHLRILEDRGDLVEREAEFPVEEDLLETDQVGLAVEPVSGVAAVAGRKQPRLVVVMQRSHRHPGEGRDLSHGVAHPPAPSSAHSFEPDVGGGSTRHPAPPLAKVGQTCSKWNALMKQSRGWATAKRMHSTSDCAVRASSAPREVVSHSSESGSGLSKSGG